MVEQTAFTEIKRRGKICREDRYRGVREVQQKKKGHVICPNCSKETDFILRKGEALVWCRRCRKYFRVSLDVIETGKRSSTGNMPEEEEQPE
jgi:ribosomal protein L37AE/L43A